jgi:ubiquinone/menaquinone biosynthesis C-methylase UbiE
MAKGIEDDEWLVSLLAIEPTDRVLEIGSGPGVAIELLAARATQGFVAGVDPSDVMVREARERNRAGVLNGQVDVRQGDAASLPFPDATFTKALALHSIYFWPSIELGLRDLHRVLRLGGRLAIGVRMHDPSAGLFNPARYGLTDGQLHDVRSLLDSRGFNVINVQNRKLRRETIAAIVARRE